MAPDAVGTKEGSNIEEKVVAELLSKLDAKCNLKVVAQNKGEKRNQRLIEGSGKGTISSMIQHSNPNRVPDVHPKEQDTRLNPEHKKGTKC